MEIQDKADIPCTRGLLILQPRVGYGLFIPSSTVYTQEIVISYLSTPHPGMHVFPPSHGGYAQ